MRNFAYNQKCEDNLSFKLDGHIQVRLHVEYFCKYL